MNSKRYLSQLFIYPIKSLPGIRVKQAEVFEKGLKYDRRWMLVDSSGKFITLRNQRRLIHFGIEKSSLGYDVSCDFLKSTIQLPLEYEGDTVEVKIWDDTVKAVEGKSGWNDWFSQALGKAVSIVYLAEDSPRPIKEKWQVNKESVSLADGYPYLIVGQESLDRLNQKLSEPIGIERFRPNLVFKGGDANEEFFWKDVMIGDVKFKGLKPCERCVVTTIDTATGEAGLEPLKTLASMKIDDKIVFGQHAVSLQEGSIKIGDPIEVLSKKNAPYDEL